VTIRHLANALLSALVAPPCAVCSRLLDAPLDGAVCHFCWNAVTPSRTLPLLLGHTISSACAIGDYEGALRDIIHALKYDGRRSIASPLSALMARHGRPVLEGADLVVPVPLHPRRQRERGFNQADVLARGLGLPVARALRRTRITASQVELPAHERRLNVLGAFALTAPLTQGPIVVMVDDVTTTGATLEACAKVLLGGGAREVRALTAARVATAPP
jgi:ComF family protein